MLLLKTGVGNAGGVEENTITFEPCANLVGEWVTVSEAQIASAMLGMSKELSSAMEGAAAMAMACFIKERTKYAGMRVVVICCGGNTDKESIEHAAQLMGC